MSEPIMIEKLEILIVDDVKDNLLALNALLKREGVEIFQAQSGNEALELMLKHDFCVALLDIQMPMMDGFELAEFMRGSNKTKNVPIIFVTAASKDENYIFKGYESGAVDFLRKPLDPHAVKSKVNVFLEIHQQKIELRNQVAELKLTRDALEKAVHVREEFMSIAGHELKTPLTSLMLQTQMRKRMLKKDGNLAFSQEKLAKMFETDDKQFERLNRLIDDMLDISRISSGKLTMEFKKFDLCELMEEILERNVEMLKLAGCALKFDSIESVTGNWDRFRIEQVITNLLTNVMRYGAGKPIEIKISTENSSAVLVIKDYGIGIAKADLERIFQRFERAKGTETTGLGLGLYIVSQIIEGHKGTIKVDSVFGEGSAFTITLPI
jgi:signal transduction histidine kinase